MKRLLTLIALFGLIVFVFVLGIETGRSVRISRAQEAVPAPSPTPVNQNYRVFYGEIDTLEIKLRELNKENVEVPSGAITISEDGKRFVVILSDEPECEDCEEN